MICKDQILKFYLEDKQSIRQIAVSLGVSYQKVRGCIPAEKRRTRSEALKGKVVPDVVRNKMSESRNNQIFKLTEDFLRQKYVNEIMTAKEIAKEVGCEKKIVLKKLKLFNLARSCGDSLRLRGTTKGENNPQFGNVGPASPGWRGGLSSLSDRIRRSWYYRYWKKDCLERDEYRCVHCGIDLRNNPYNVDHIKPMALILKENFVTNWEQAKSCEALWDRNNGRSMCEPCHKKTDTYGYGCVKLLKEAASG